jgi:hypothetical protein
MGGIDPVWGILSLGWVIASIVGMLYAYLNYNVLVVAFAFAMAVLVPHLVCYGFALVRIGTNGNPGFAVGCFITCGIGELFALASASANVDKWKLQRILPIWQCLFAMLFVVGAVNGAAQYYDDGKTANPFQKKRPVPVARQAPAPPPADQPEPYLNPGQPKDAPANPAVSSQPIPGPPMPAIVPFGGDQEPFFTQVAERLTANREGLVQFLPTIVDTQTAQAAAPRFFQFEIEYRDTAKHRPQGGFYTSKESIDRIYKLTEREWQAQQTINTELERIKAIPDAVKILELGNSRTPRISRPQSPNRGNSRPPVRPRVPGRR